MTLPSQWRIGLRDSKDRIWIDFPFAVNGVEVGPLLKERVAGLRYDKGAGFFHAPLDMETAKDIASVAKYFGGKLFIDGPLANWIRGEKQRYANLLKPDDFLADQSQWLPRLRKERPKLIAAMEKKPWQIPGAAFMVGQSNVLLADVPGLGKTIQTLAAVAERDIRGPILVVAPKSAVHVTWPDEIEQWLGLDEVEDELVFPITGDMKPLERKLTLKAVADHCASNPNLRVWVLCGPNYLRIRPELDDYGNYKYDAKGHKIVRTVNEGLADLFAIRWSAVIVDESHQTLAGASGNKKKQSAQRLGLGALTIKDGGLQIAISGTPFRGKTENLWGTLNWLAPKKYTSYWNWVKRHYGIVNTGSQWGSGIAKGGSILDEKRFFKELQPYMVRRTYTELKAKKLIEIGEKFNGGTHLHPHDLNSPIAVWLPMGQKQQAQYDKVVDDALLTIDEMGDTIDVNGVLAEMTRLKQVANACLERNSNYDVKPIIKKNNEILSNKAEWIEQFLVDRIDAGTKTIVASQFTGFIDALSEYLDSKKIKHFTLTGKTKPDERSYIKNRFQDDSNQDEMVVLINTKAGGVSLTLDAADDVVICDQTWIPDDQEQVENRAYRVSRNHNVTVWYLASLGTIDEDIAITNVQREDSAKSILDKQRGVIYVRQLIQMTKKRQEKKVA
jgi:SNF2 family DNA or RNA helicase